MISPMEYLFPEGAILILSALVFCSGVLYLFYYLRARRQQAERDKNVKIVYFIRHGETVLNARRIRQGADGPLSPLGVEQAQFLAERASRMPIDVIIASPFERARETAAIVSKKIGKKVEYCDYLAERRNPTEIIGQSYDDPQVQMIIDKIDKSFHDENFRYSDEENTHDLKVRAIKLLEYLEARPEKRILAVTHGIFLKMVASYMLYRDNLKEEDYIKLSFFNDSGNAGVTLCKFDPADKDGENKGWTLVAWNDFADLKDLEKSKPKLAH